MKEPKRDDYHPCDCQRAWREEHVEWCGGCEEYRAAVVAWDTQIEAADDAGEMDGLVAGSQPGYCDFDPRGAFIRRPELPEWHWKVYEGAFERAFNRALAANEERRRAG